MDRKVLKYRRSWNLILNTDLGPAQHLISNLSGWAEIDPYKLLQITFGGSGYDIACAKAKSPIFFTLNDGNAEVHKSAFKPLFHEQLAFVYLGQKQVSRESIKRFKRNSSFSTDEIRRVSQIAYELEQVTDLAAFEQLLREHEEILSNILETETVQQRLFPDHSGIVKSLGGWGGDFVLMTFS